MRRGGGAAVPLTASSLVVLGTRDALHGLYGGDVVDGGEYHVGGVDERIQDWERRVERYEVQLSRLRSRFWLRCWVRSWLRISASLHAARVVLAVGEDVAEGAQSAHDDAQDERDHLSKHA